ncbi:hypothetical protein [Deinococcus carri]|uniref:hypothetical protein n=1 Tax=Deinococcus carri TaxID=1211323 RepID=UPI0031F074B1
MDAFPLLLVLSPLGWVLLALLVVGVALVVLTFLIPRRFWGLLLLVGCPVLLCGPVVVAGLLGRS